MNILILIKSDNDLSNIQNCKTRMEFFVYTLSTLLPNVSLKNCSQNLNNISVDHTIFVSETGFYYENNNLLKNIRQFTKYTVSTLALSGKFYTCEDIMFGLTRNTLNSKYIYVKPPLDQDLYIARSTDLYYIYFDDKKELYNLQMINMSETIKKLDINNTIILCSISNEVITYYDIDMNLIQTLNFDSYLDYINEISKANLYIVTSTCSDIYKLYELSMCNVLIVSHDTYIPKNIVDELNIYTYTNIDNVNWPNIFEVSEEFNIREKLCMYTWSNMTSIMLNELSKYDNEIKKEQVSNIKVKTLNITNCNKPKITDKTLVNDANYTNKICDILEISQNKKPVPKKKILLQSNILQHR